ncbi:MAG: hypothetical protein P4L51_16870 [Puia sp.]|nr:hypothetical protein [Puia sp.]
MAKKTKDRPEEETGKPRVWGDPEYSEKDDIYSREEKEPFDESEESPVPRGKKIKNTKTGEDLDVPGSELDDADEEIGEEDEENNYYSLGGDDHDDLEEDKGD